MVITGNYRKVENKKKTFGQFSSDCVNLEAVAAKMNEAGGIQMITNMDVFDIILVHILNHPFHRIYQTLRNDCRPATMEEIEQCTVLQVMQIDGVAKGKIEFCKFNGFFPDK